MHACPGGSIQLAKLGPQSLNGCVWMSLKALGEGVPVAKAPEKRASDRQRLGGGCCL